MRKIVAVAIMVIALAGCDPNCNRWWPIGPREPTQAPQEHKLVCQHYWPDGHTGCNEEPGTG